jgi:pimeloyl-ACP methyl ester carboxylesterase
MSLLVESTVTVRGLSLRLSSWGPPDGELVVCLHGFLDQGASWEPVGLALAALGYRVVAPDARGHGLSDHVGAGGYYHFTDYLVDLDGLAEQLSPEQPFNLVGHSMGGAVATLYAGVRPDRVAALVNIEGLGPPRVSDEHAVGQMVTHLRQLRGTPQHRPLADLDDAVARMRAHTPELPEAEARRLAERVTEPWQGGLRWRWDPLHRTRGAIAFDVDRFVLVLGRIRAPVTLVIGATSPFALDDGEERFACLATARKVRLPSGHHPHFECPERLATVLDESLEWARGQARGELVSEEEH